MIFSHPPIVVVSSVGLLSTIIANEELVGEGMLFSAVCQNDIKEFPLERFDLKL